MFTASLAKYADPLLDLMDKVRGLGQGVAARRLCGVGQQLAQGSNPQQTNLPQAVHIIPSADCL